MKKVEYGTVENKLWISKLSWLIKITVIVLLIVGFLLIDYSFRHKNDLEEFFIIPFVLGIIDLIGSYFFIVPNIGYRVILSGETVIISKFSKEKTRISLKNCDMIYKKRFLYDLIEFYSKDKGNVFYLPSYWFSKNDFEDIKETLMKIRKYYAQQE